MNVEPQKNTVLIWGFAGFLLFFGFSGVYMNFAPRDGAHSAILWLSLYFSCVILVVLFRAPHSGKFFSARIPIPVHRVMIVGSSLAMGAFFFSSLYFTAPALFTEGVGSPYEAVDIIATRQSCELRRRCPICPRHISLESHNATLCIDKELWHDFNVGDKVRLYGLASPFGVKIKMVEKHE